MELGLQNLAYGTWPAELSLRTERGRRENTGTEPGADGVELSVEARDTKSPPSPAEHGQVWQNTGREPGAIAMELSAVGGTRQGEANGHKVP